MHNFKIYNTERLLTFIVICNIKIYFRGIFRQTLIIMELHKLFSITKYFSVFEIFIFEYTS